MKTAPLLLLLVLAGATAPAAAPAPTPVSTNAITRRATFDAVVRETADQEWRLFYTGVVPVYSWAGAGLVVHDDQGRVLHRTIVPRGVYSNDAPYVVTIKPDGRTGDYRIVMTGHQIQFLGICGTLQTDLAFDPFVPSTNLLIAPFWKDFPK